MSHVPSDPAYAPSVATSAVVPADRYSLSTVSWGAILAGVVIGLVVQVAFTLLGAAIGVATLDPGTADNPSGATFSILSGIWTLVSIVASTIAGAFIAARLSGRADADAGGLHGLTVWAVSTLLVIYLLTSTLGAVVGGAFRGVSSAIGGAGQIVAEAAGPALAEVNPLDMIEQRIAATGTDPEALQANAVNAMRALVMSGEEGAEEARAEAAEALAEARNIPLPQAQEQVADIEQGYRDAVAATEEAAIAAADQAATVVSTGSFVAVLALILGGLAGWFGGRAGTIDPRRVVVR